MRKELFCLPTDDGDYLRLCRIFQDGSVHYEFAILNPLGDVVGTTDVSLDEIEQLLTVLETEIGELV
jgi:hypothetical protein